MLAFVVRSLTDVKLEVLGGFKRKTMARSWPPVREAKWWIRARVPGRLDSEVEETDRRRTRSWRTAMVSPVSGTILLPSGIVRSWVSSLFSA